MHEVLHVAILVTTVAGVAGLALLVLWPLIGDTPLPAASRWVLGALVATAAVLFLLEWRVVH